MRLMELNPRWLGAGGEGIRRKNEQGEWVPVPERTGVGIICDCPCRDPECPELLVQFKQPLDGGLPHDERESVLWDRTGDTFDTLTLRPSIQRLETACRWHGFIINGDVITA